MKNLLPSTVRRVFKRVKTGNGVFLIEVAGSAYVYFVETDRVIFVKDIYVMTKVKIALIMPECYFDDTGCTIVCKGGRRLITDANNRGLVKTRLLSRLYRGTCQFISSAKKPKPFRDDDSGIRCSSNKCAIRHHHRHPEGEEELDPDYHYEEIAAAAPTPKPSATST